jgi:PPOX class probable F420-dependent enzyme
MTSYQRDPRTPTPSYLAFWRERHLCTLTTLRADGTPHVVPVGATYDPGAGLARVITSGSSAKAAQVRRAGAAGAPVALCQFEGRRWATLEGRAVIRTAPDLVADAEQRYEERYGHPPRPNPQRVVIEIALTSALGNC